MSSVYDAIAKAYSKGFKKVKSGFDKVRDGKYVVKFSCPTLGYSKKKKYRCLWEMKVIWGDYAKRLLFKSHNLEESDSQSVQDLLGFLIADMKRLGLPIPAFKELYLENPKKLMLRISEALAQRR